MESLEKNEIRVGLFVAGGLALLLTSILLLGGDKYFFRNTYQLRTQMNHVQGLVEGSVVSLSGINIGVVKKMTFTSDSKLDLSLQLDRDFSDRITESSVASIRTQGALGDKFIYIEPGPAGKRPLKDGEHIAADLSGDIFDLIKEKGSELGHLVDVIREVHILLKGLNDENRATVLMSNMVSSSENLNKLLLDARGAIQDIRGEKSEKGGIKLAVNYLVNILEKVDSGKGTLGEIINNPSIHERLISLLGDSPRNKFLKPLIRESVAPKSGEP
jgi:phospholipid/cholesterol/gamma-HCH transport system substrate-binding protein